MVPRIRHSSIHVDRHFVPEPEPQLVFDDLIKTLIAAADSASTVANKPGQH
jgi:hypothetical protein